VPTELFVAPMTASTAIPAPAPRRCVRSRRAAAQLVTPGTTVNVLPRHLPGRLPHQHQRLAERPHRVPLDRALAGAHRAAGGVRQRHGLGQPRQLHRHPGLRGRRRRPGAQDGAGTALDHRHLQRRLLQPHRRQPRARHRHRLPCTSKGGSGIGVDSYYKGMYSEVVGNSVHDIGPPGCRYVQGIYVNTPGTVRNNIVYRVAEAGIHLWHDAHKVSWSTIRWWPRTPASWSAAATFITPRARTTTPTCSTTSCSTTATASPNRAPRASTTATATTWCSATRRPTGAWPRACAQRHAWPPRRLPQATRAAARRISAWRRITGAARAENGADGPDFYGKARGRQRDAGRYRRLPALKGALTGSRSPAPMAGTGARPWRLHERAG
jgi:hypothetical protein